MIDLTMMRRKDGLIATQALESEWVGVAISWSPDEDLDDIRTLVVRWPAFVTVLLVGLVLVVVARLM